MRQIRVVDGDKLLAVIVRYSGVDIPIAGGASRQNISPEKELLQVAVMEMEGGKIYPPHYHIAQDKPNGACQEAWVVVHGCVVVQIYSESHELKGTFILNPGDCVVNFSGGHGYRCSGTALVYEFKTGPYLGGDKVMIE